MQILRRLGHWLDDILSRPDATDLPKVLRTVPTCPGCGGSTEQCRPVRVDREAPKGRVRATIRCCVDGVEHPVPITARQAFPVCPTCRAPWGDCRPVASGVEMETGWPYVAVDCVTQRH